MKDPAYEIAVAKLYQSSVNVEFSERAGMVASKECSSTCYETNTLADVAVDLEAALENRYGLPF